MDQSNTVFKANEKLSPGHIDIFSTFTNVTTGRVPTAGPPQRSPWKAKVVMLFNFEKGKLSHSEWILVIYDIIPKIVLETCGSSAPTLGYGQ